MALHFGQGLTLNSIMLRSAVGLGGDKRFLHQLYPSGLTGQEPGQDFKRSAGKVGSFSNAA